MKKLLLLALLVSCAPLTMQAVPCEGGALCQGSRAWKEHNLCVAGRTSGACIEAVRGPFVVTGINSGDSCPNGLMVSVADTFGNTGDIESKEHWKMSVPANTKLWIQNVHMSVPAGQSLFVGSDGFNDVNRSSKCYVTWEGHVP